MDQKANGVGTAAAAGIAGAVVGAGVAIAASKVMSDKNMRDKVTGALGSVKDTVMEAIDTAKTNGQSAAAQAQGKIDSAKKEMKSAASKS